MKRIMLCLCLFLFLYSVAQPGDTRRYKKERFKGITELLNKSPNDYPLMWERVNLIFRPDINLYTKSGFSSERLRYDEEPMFDFSNDDLLSDLNTLINADAKIRINNNTEENRADFILRRGQLYYSMNEKDKALADYLSALELTKDREQRRKIFISLAAYYYNLPEELSSKENTKKALQYIDLASPLEFTQDFNDRSSYNYYERIYDYYEQNKKDLLEYLEEDQRLENYLKQLIINDYEIMQREKSSTTVNDFTKSNNYISILNRINELAKFYYKKKNYKKAKILSERALELFPKNSWGHIFQTFDAQVHYALLHQIYKTDEFRDFNKEMYYGLELLGDPRQGTGFNLAETEKEILESLQQHPDEPRLYLALAICRLKNRDDRISVSETSVFPLLDKAEALKLVHYKIPYMRALVYDYHKKYAEGLKEIDKALALYQGNPNLYSIKYHLILNLPDPDIEEAKKLDEESKKRMEDKEYGDLSGLVAEIQKK